MLVITMASSLQTPPRVAHSKPPGPKGERPKVGNNNGQLRIANATSGGARKPPGPILINLWGQERVSKGYNIFLFGGGGAKKLMLFFLSEGGR